MHDRPRRARTARWLVVAALATSPGTACRAPVSQPAEGPIADDIKTSLQSGGASFEHGAWDRLLAAGTRDGQVDYAYFAREREQLDHYLAGLASAELATLSPDHLKALLINAYNALTVKSILDNPGVASIREIDGVWKKVEHTVGGHPLTLDEIEHNLLRPFWKDPRIHFAVNCASASCAPLPGWAYDGAALEAQLEERTRSFLADRSQVRIEDGALKVSKYFDWYGDDFQQEGWEPRAETWLQFIAAYGPRPVAEHIAAASGRPAVTFLDYDWSLNAAP